jgi:hypothetical protein
VIENVTRQLFSPGDEKFKERANDLDQIVQHQNQKECSSCGKEESADDISP